MSFSRHPDAPHIIAFTGFMAAGKSTVGRALASLLRWRFIDLDSEIECRSGRSIRELFTELGENGFRKLESEALGGVLQTSGVPTVIALGGGTFVQPQNAGLLRDAEACVVFLELDPEKLLQRCRAVGERCDPNPRPLAEDEEAFFALYERRLPLYRAAQLTVEAESKPPEQIARQIAEMCGLMSQRTTER